MSTFKTTLIGIGLITLIACSTTTSVAPQATVSFVLVAPLCSSVIPVQLSIDHAVVATDTFRVNVTAPSTMSPGYPTSAGSHVLGARTAAGFIWPDKTVTLTTGQMFTDSLPTDCS